MKSNVNSSVLHAVFQRIEPQLGPAGIVEIAESRRLAQRRDDVVRRLVLENPAIAPVRQHPQPRPQLDPVAARAPAHSGIGDASDDAVEIARAAVRLHHRNRHRTAKHRDEVRLGVGARHQQLIEKRAPKLLGAGQRVENERETRIRCDRNRDLRRPRARSRHMSTSDRWKPEPAGPAGPGRAGGRVTNSLGSGTPGTQPC